MKLQWKKLAHWALATFLLLPINSFAAEINSVLLTKDSLAALPSCLHYKIIGLCFYTVCGWGGCTVVAMPKVEHYLPDLVDTVYSKYGNDPWFLINHTIDKADHLAGNAAFKALNGLEVKSGSSNTVNHSNNDMKLREVDIIGNPALSALANWGFLLQSQATPLFPYYQSQLDSVEWRSGLLELLFPQTWEPGKDVVGKYLTDDWGSTYPRSGFLIQDNSGKASAVYAVRGANIATTPSFDHISHNLNAVPCPNRDCTTSGAILGNSPKVEWQMVLPSPSDTCHASIAYTAKPAWVVHQKNNEAYTWIVWREYSGCLPPFGNIFGRTYLGSVE